MSVRLTTDELFEKQPFDEYFWLISRESLYAQDESPRWVKLSDTVKVLRTHTSTVSWGSHHVRVRTYHQGHGSIQEGCIWIECFGRHMTFTKDQLKDVSWETAPIPPKVNT